MFFWHGCTVLDNLQMARFFTHAHHDCKHTSFQRSIHSKQKWFLYAYLANNSLLVFTSIGDKAFAEHTLYIICPTASRCPPTPLIREFSCFKVQPLLTQLVYPAKKSTANRMDHFYSPCAMLSID